jgi:hypothetical protein
MTMKIMSVSSYAVLFQDLEIGEHDSQGSRIERRARNADVTPTTQACQYIRSEGSYYIFIHCNTINFRKHSIHSIKMVKDKDTVIRYVLSLNVPVENKVVADIKQESSMSLLT